MVITASAQGCLATPHIVRGQLIDDCVVEHPGAGLATPVLDLDALVWPRKEPLPAAGLDLDEVLDFLAATGRALDLDTNEHLRWALESLSVVNPLGRQTLENNFRTLPQLFDRGLLEFEHEQAFGATRGGWREMHLPSGETFSQRWFPTRTVHVMAGNLPTASVLGIVRIALVRGAALLKLPSNDPFTAVAVLRTMADLDPRHPLVQSFSAAYWRGGDVEVESVLFRPQFFDKLIAWGGEGAIRNAIRYVGPGFELVTFDPKTAISMIGPEAFADAETTRRVAGLSARDIQYQAACGSSRRQYVQGAVEQVDAYCEALVEALHRYHEVEQGECVPTPQDIVDEVEVIRSMEPVFRAWGAYDGTGLVVRSDEPLGFYPENRTVNVVQVDDLADAVQFIDIATQTVGLFPPALTRDYRDALAAAGADRICQLGGTSGASTGNLGKPHDGMIPLQRFVRWAYSQA